MPLALLTFATGLAALWAAWTAWREVRRTRGWPTTSGRILARGVGEPMGGPGRSYLPAVRYTYTVDGTPYEGDQVYSLRRTGGGADRMRRLTAGLPDPVPVHYNPADPARSYLLPTPPATLWLLTALGVVVTVVGALLVLIAALGV